MFVDFLFALRKRQVPVGPLEWMTLVEALEKNLHGSTLTGFYDVARAVLVHSEAHLDAFDEAFAEFFHGVEVDGARLLAELDEWLKDPKALESLDPAMLARLSALDLETLRALFEARLREQRERHDGGSKWIGTGGTSPFGRGGAHPSGIRVGGSSGTRSAVKVAAERRWRGYRKDLVLDVRQFGVALRKLRRLAREGSEEELDLDGTIDRTSRNAGELEVVMRPPRKSSTRVLLLLDVGGSMDPFVKVVSTLLTAASQASHFRELRTYYFHNCIYGRVYTDERFEKWRAVPDLLREIGKEWKLVLVGDALMGPSELLQSGGSIDYFEQSGAAGITWLRLLTEHFKRSAWLNPEPPAYWRQGTCETIAKLFPMFSLTVEGIDDAARHLSGGRSRGPLTHLH